MSEIDRLVQKLFPGVLVEVYDLDLTPRGGPTLYFSNWVREDGNWVQWRGNRYQPVAMEATGYELNGDGKPSRPQLTMANTETESPIVNATLGQLCDQYDNFTGCRLRRWRTYRQFLDDGESPDIATHLPTETYRVNAMTERTPLSIKWELGVRYDHPGMELPKGIMTQKYCNLEYRQWNPATGQFDYTYTTCPYVGSQYFDESGNPVADPKDDKPSKRLDTCCRKRFGLEAPLPTGAFPGMVKVTRRS